MCSATWPPEVRRLTTSYMKNPFQVYVGSLDLRVSVVVWYTVKPLIMDTPIRGQPPYNGQTACPLPLTVHTFLPPTKGQPPNNGQNARPQRVHYSEVPLYHKCTVGYKSRSLSTVCASIHVTSHKRSLTHRPNPQDWVFWCPAIVCLFDLYVCFVL